MVGRRRALCIVSCLAFVCILVCTRPFVTLNDLLWPFDNRSRSLAQDTLQAANDAVHEAMLFLLEAHKSNTRTTFVELGISGTEFKRPRALPNNLHRESLLRNTVLDGPRSAKWRYVADIDHIDTCGFLAGKRVTMIGGEHVYRLHVLLLQLRERAEKKQFPCPYHEFCTHHHVCLPYQRSRDGPPPPRYVKPPTTQELVDTRSATVNYIVSDTLFSARNESAWEYNLPYVDPMTGVRLRETYWLAAARKANVIVLGRGPLSAPSQTYSGNWSFLRHFPDYVGKSRALVVGEYGDLSKEQLLYPRPLEVLSVAVHLTVSRFLPELFQLLESIRRDIHPGKRKRLVWSSSWYRLPGRGSGRTVLLGPHSIHWKISHDRRAGSWAEYLLTLQLSALIDADVMNTGPHEDPWTLLFNAQVYLQNTVLKEVLPWYDITFLPLEVPWVGDGRDVEDANLKREMAIGEAFLRGVDYVLRH